ncbi:MAG TPA: hypothetical protein DEQ65_01080, partial [Ruminococcaceae bacterium]|nr:hypothetical protein [Oscillospiraceae bacterium]
TRTAMTGRQLIAHFMVVAMTKRLVILSAWRERIRLPFKENGLPQPLHGFAMTKRLLRAPNREHLGVSDIFL